MARHRINENGHMMWFDTDEEYQQYRKRKNAPVVIIMVIWVIIGFISAMSHDDNKEEVEEAVVSHSSVEEESNEQIMSVANQSELVDIGEEINDDMMPEPLEVSQEQSEVNDVDVMMDYENIESEEIKPDYSRQKVYDIVDEMPTFSDGDYELLKYIADNLEYPQEAVDGGIQGTVFVRIIVEPDGSISNPKIIRGIGYGCDKEAVRVIESMPNWEPGHRKGEAVRVYMSIPVSFKLQ